MPASNKWYYVMTTFLTPLLTVFSALLLSSSVSAQQCNDPPSTMLWQIEGSANPVYLMGSIHVGRPDLYPLEPIVEELFRSADHLVFEVDPAQLANPAIALDIQRRGMLPPGQSLSDHVSEETLIKLDKVLADIGMPRQLVMQMQPWLIINVLASLQIVELELMPQLGTENYMLLSKSPEADVLELESLEEQLVYLASMNDEIYLRETLESFGTEGEEMITAMLAAWQCADHEELNRVMSLEYEDPDMDAVTRAAMAELEETLLYGRNEKMAEVISAYADEGEGSYFVVVGSAHLLGERSVMEHLRQQGYTISPVRQE